MKFLRMLGLATMAAATLAVSPGPASASVFTSGEATYTGFVSANSGFGYIVIHSENAPIPFTVECNSNFPAANISEHGASVTARMSLGFLNFNSCTNGVTVQSVNTGSMEFHATGGGNGTVTWNNVEVVAHVPLGFKCIYLMSSTDVGTFTGGTSPTIDLASPTMLRTGGSAFCGTGGFLTGQYKIWSPTSLYLD
jgi:hypothetical protein